ncbi:hypothetical protein GH714_035664 [Hevea brasiliensis]|uniref:Uncharacterized protein n=1 Tax=Hevea brasiliensis TaxID=3981 RepID=A0A6A6N728_HEVBR|nr:hypothetical protein GH714_035664 [Hevea brasiliensis]
MAGIVASGSRKMEEIGLPNRVICCSGSHMVTGRICKAAGDASVRRRPRGSVGWLLQGTSLHKSEFYIKVNLLSTLKVAFLSNMFMAMKYWIFVNNGFYLTDLHDLDEHTHDHVESEA